MTPEEITTLCNVLFLASTITGVIATLAIVGKLVSKDESDRSDVLKLVLIIAGCLIAIGVVRSGVLNQ